MGSKFKMGDRVVEDKDADCCNDLIDHWNDYWAKNEGSYSGAFYITAVGDNSVTYSARPGGNGPIIPPAYLKHAPLTIESGKFYMTRDGRRVGPSFRYNDGWCMRGEGGKMWKTDGERYFGDDEETWLIAEAPTSTYTANAAAEVDNLADEYGGGKPRFKVGDRVRVTHTDYPQIPVGTITHIVGADSDGEGVDLWADGFEDGLYFYADEFVAVPPTTSAIVALIENGQPKPSHIPYVHNTRASAEIEAKRLAGKHKGKEFGVYELLSTIKEEPVYEHEWQRLAAEHETYEAVSVLMAITGLDRPAANAAVKDWSRRKAA